MTEAAVLQASLPVDDSLGDRVSRFSDPLERLLYLRLESQLVSLSAHELSLLAQHSDGCAYAEGEYLMMQGAPAPAIHFLVEGKVSLRSNGVTYLKVKAPAVVGMIPVLSGDKHGVEAIADEDVVTLTVAAHVLLDLVEDNFRFMEGALRAVSGELQKIQRRLEVLDLLQRSEPNTDVSYPQEPLDLITRLKFLRRGVYSDVNLEALIELIRGAKEVRFEAGEVLWEVGDTSDHSLSVVYGVILCEEPRGARTFVMGPNSNVGVLEANAGLARSYKATAKTRLVAIRSTVEDFFDVLEDHTQLGMGLLRALCRRVLQLQMESPMPNEVIMDSKRPA